MSVKWQKEVFEDVEIDTTQPPLVFKAQLYALSGVPPERQKIMVKGGMLKVYISTTKLLKPKIRCLRGLAISTGFLQRSAHILPGTGAFHVPRSLTTFNICRRMKANGPSMG